MASNTFSAADTQILCARVWADFHRGQEETLCTHRWYCTITIIGGVDLSQRHRALDSGGTRLGLKAWSEGEWIQDKVPFFLVLGCLQSILSLAQSFIDSLFVPDLSQCLLISEEKLRVTSQSIGSCLHLPNEGFANWTEGRWIQREVFFFPLNN